MPYVERDEAGAIKGVYANLQPGYAEEWVEHAELPRRVRGDALPVILTSMALRIDALESARPGATSSAPMPLPIAPVEDEDPGEQPEIYDEEDVANAAPATGSGSVDLGEDVGAIEDAEAGSGNAYPGIAILPDELGARRNAVLAAITTEKLTRLSIAMDPSRADFLAARFAEYQNAGALGLAIDDALAADYRAFQDLRDRRDRITTYAMQLEQSALDGDMDRLSAMHAGLGDGWP